MLNTIKVESIITTLIGIIDELNPILKSHHRRVAVIAYHIGKAYGLSETSLSDLVIAASLHDIGALTVSESQQLVKLDVENPEPHSVLGEGMLKSYEPFHKISKIIRYHHVNYEEWENDEIAEDVPIESFIVHLADRIDILLDPNQISLNQVRGV